MEDIKPKVSHGIVTGEHGNSYQSSLGQSYLPSRNGQLVEPTGNGYQYNQAVGKVQLPQSDSMEAAKDHQQLPQVDRVQNPVFNESVISALLTQQLLPLSKFRGGEVNNGGMDTFQDWFEQFEMIANVCGWSPQARLVNLVTRLEGQAYAFFHSCTTQQKTSYALLVTELHKRFTPIHLQAVQSSLFHDRKQKPGELVDHYAQELCVLFYAYPHAQQGTLEAEKLGQLVLVNQFVTGLLGDIKTKIVGIEGSFDQLLVRAKVEEAKLQDLSTTSTGSLKSSGVTSNEMDSLLSVQSSGATVDGSNNKHQRSTTSRFNVAELMCDVISPSHLIRRYPYLVRSRATETPGTKMIEKSTNKGCVSNVTSAEMSGGDREQLTESEKEGGHGESDAVDIREDINKVFITMHGVTSSDVSGKLGPVLTSIVEVEGEPVETLLDTGSPVTIIALEWLLQLSAKQHRKDHDQSPNEWKVEVENRLEPTTMVLQNYSRDRLKVVRQIRVHLARSGFVVETSIQVQKAAPAKLLIGTDVLPELGYLFVQSTVEGEDFDLLRSKCTNSNDEQENESEVKPEVKVNYDNEGITTESDSNQVLDKDTYDCGLSELVGTVHLIEATKLPARHKKW